jgi:hypothetical protein
MDFLYGLLGKILGWIFDNKAEGDMDLDGTGDWRLARGCIDLSCDRWERPAH